MLNLGILKIKQCQGDVLKDLDKSEKYLSIDETMLTILLNIEFNSSALSILKEKCIFCI